MSNLTKPLAFTLLILVSNAIAAKDIIKINLAQSALDQRVEYKTSLLRLVLDATKDEYGDYEIYSLEESVTRKRALSMMAIGEAINVYIAPADQDWEDNTIAIRVPIRKGLLNYRILLTTNEHVENLGNIKTVEDLKQFRLGLREQWTTTKVMKALGFISTGGVDYNGLFNMLNANRFDYIPRGVNEIFGEYDVRHEDMPNLAIESNIALYLPMPVYFYVSNLHPNLAARLERGFDIIIENGSFDELFMQHFGEAIQKADLASRRIIKLGNPLLSPQTPLNESKYWFYPIDQLSN